MNVHVIPINVITGDSTAAANKYFVDRFPNPTMNKNENPNQETSGCGVSMNTGASEQSYTITDPNDNSKVLCEMIYSQDGLKFSYQTPEMIKNVNDIGVGAPEKLNILEDEFNILNMNIVEKV